MELTRQTETVFRQAHFPVLTHIEITYDTALAEYWYASNAFPLAQNHLLMILQALMASISLSLFLIASSILFMAISDSSSARERMAGM